MISVPDAVAALRAEGDHGLALLRRLSDQFGARPFPAPSGIVFHGSSIERDELVPYTSVRFDKADPAEPAIFWTTSADAAALCAIFNRGRLADQVAAGLMSEDGYRRMNFTKAWVPSRLRVGGPATVLDELETTDSGDGLVVTPAMWSVACAQQPEGWVHVALPEPPIDPPQAFGDYHLSMRPVRPAAAVRVTFEELAPLVVQAEKGTVTFEWVDGRPHA